MRWPIAAILGALAVLLGAVAASFPDPGVPANSYWCPNPVLVGVDFYPPYVAAHALRARLPIYDNLRDRGGPFVDPVADHAGLTSRYTYPPPVAYLTVPLSWFPVGTAWKIRSAAVVAGTVLAVGMLIHLAGGGAGFALALAALCAAFYPLHFALINGNVALPCIILVICSASFWDRRRGGVWAGLALALAIMVKLYPALLLAGLALRRRWRLLGYACLALAALATLTSGGGAWLRFLERAVEFDRFPQVKDINASLFSVSRLLGRPHGVSLWTARGLAAAAVGLALWLTRRPAGAPRTVLLDLGLLCAAPLLALNTNYDYNLVFLLPGLAALLETRRPRGPLVLAALAFVVLSAPTHWVLGVVERWGLTGHEALAAANKFPGLLLFFAALAWSRWAVAPPPRTCDTTVRL